MMRASNVIIILLSAALIQLLVLPGPTSLGDPIPEHSFGGGSGTNGDPYVIEDVWDLQNMSKDLTAHYVLGNDIDASDTVNWNSGAGFDPIGTYKWNDPSLSFNGGLDGRNFTIFGLYIDRPHKHYVGLFGNIGKGAYVRDLSIVDCEINGNAYDIGGLSGSNEGSVTNIIAYVDLKGSGVFVGGLIGSNYGTLSSSFVTGTVEGISSIGGFVGYNYNAVITDCHAAVEVTGTEYVGGLIGNNQYGNVSGSISEGHVVGSRNHIGGSVGFNNGRILNGRASVTVVGDGNGIGGFVGSNKGIISNCQATGNVTGKDLIGGLVGYSFGDLFNCTASGDVLGQTGLGGLIGQNEGDVSGCASSGRVMGIEDIGGLAGYNDGIISECRSSGDLLADRHVGGLLGRNNGTMTNSFYNVDDVKINGENCITLGGIYDHQYEDWVANGLSLNISSYSSSLVPSGDHYEIKDAEGLRDLLGFCVMEGYRFRLNADIDLSEYPGLYIPYFASMEFDGNDHNVSNISLPFNYISSVGFIGINQGGTIRNLRCIDSDFSGDRYVGGLIGMNRGSVLNCFSKGVVKGDSYVGGMVGENEGSVSFSFSKGEVSGKTLMGGFTGVNHGTLSNCYSWSEASGTGDHIGGFAGRNSGMVMESYATGRTSGNWNVGGLVGWNTGSVSNSFWDIQTTHQISSDGGLGRMTEDMMKADTFLEARWDMVNKWCMIDGRSYPFFRWEDIVPPSAVAGPDRIVHEGTTVFLDGSYSVDNKGIDNWTWSFMDGGPVVLYGVWQTHTFNNPGYFDITLNVSDPSGNWDKDVMRLTVRDVKPPVADAGPDLMVDEGDLVKFDGSGSFDSGGITNYTWTFTDRVSIRLFGIEPIYIFMNPGMFIITLNVSDPVGQWHTDTVVVGVRDLTPPVADAGPDIIVNEDEDVIFDGGRCEDNGIIVNWTWEFMDGGPVSLYGESPSYNFKDPGLFAVTLNVKDADGNRDEDTFNVTVRDITAPLAVAGSERTVVDEGDVVTFDGSGSQDNVGVVNWTWTFNDLNKVYLYGVNPAHLFDNPGIFEVVLNVTDSWGNYGIDTITITVRETTPPVANAGPNRTVTEGDVLIFDGSGSFDNVGIVNWTWTFHDGSDDIVLFGISPSHIFPKPGTYIVTLTVRDDAGNEHEDTMVVQVLKGKDKALQNMLMIIVSIIVLALILLSVLLFFLLRREKPNEE